MPSMQQQKESSFIPDQMTGSSNSLDSEPIQKYARFPSGACYLLMKQQLRSTHKSLMDCFSHACKDFGLTISLKKRNVLGHYTEAPPVITTKAQKAHAKFEIRDTKFGIRNAKFGIRRVWPITCMRITTCLKQNMTDAAEETLRVCGSSGVVFAFIVGPEGNFRMEELGRPTW